MLYLEENIDKILLIYMSNHRLLFVSSGMLVLLCPKEEYPIGSRNLRLDKTVRSRTHTKKQATYLATIVQGVAGSSEAVGASLSRRSDGTVINL